MSFCADLGDVHAEYLNTENTSISVIIVNYNAGPLLRRCLDSLLVCPLAIEIIVVDNASHDRSLDGLPDSPRIRVIRNHTKVGFAAACNIGIDARIRRANRRMGCGDAC